jgi:hypothetical protein
MKSSTRTKKIPYKIYAYRFHPTGSSNLPHHWRGNNKIHFPDEFNALQMAMQMIDLQVSRFIIEFHKFRFKLHSDS